MPVLLSLEQPSAVQAVQERSVVFAFLDDVHAVTSPCLRRCVLLLRVKNREQSGGVRPTACDVLQRVAQAVTLSLRVWR